MNILRRAQILGLRFCFLFFCFSVIGATGGCASGGALVATPTTQLGVAAAPFPMSWWAPETAGDRTLLGRWRLSVGSPLYIEGAPTAGSADDVDLVSWNVAVGDADVVSFLRARPADRPLIVLLQEAFRQGPAVPSALDSDASFARQLGCARAKARPHAVEGAAAAAGCDDIVAAARELGLSLYYVPSMRNGGATSNQDRGNAILSNLPLTDLTAIELPFERQRRVAIAARVSGRRADGTPWSLRVVNTHLDNLGGLRRAWIGAEFGRARQARGLVGVIGGSEPTVLAGDFNTWFGFSEATYVETIRAFPDTRVTDRRPTFRGLMRLDHIFFRLAAGWSGEFRRGDDRYGSDHYPLVGRIRFR